MLTESLLILLSLVKILPVTRASSSSQLYDGKGYLLKSVWEERATNKRRIQYAITEAYCSHALLSEDTKEACPACNAFIFEEKEKICEIGTAPEAQYLIEAPPEHGVLLYVTENVNYEGHIMMVHKDQIYGFHIEGSEVTEVFPIRDGFSGMTNDLEIAYMASRKTFYFCSNVQRSGTKYKLCYSYVLGAEDFEQIPSLRIELAEAFMGVVLDSYLWVAGGVVDTNYEDSLSTSEYFDPKTNQWNAGPDLPARMGGGCLLTADSNNFYFVGGAETDSNGDAQISNKLHHFQWTTNTWTSLTDLPAPRYRPNCGMFTHSDDSLRIGVLGGSTVTDEAGVMSSFYIYNIGTDQWEDESALMPLAMYRGVGVGIGHRFITIGGSDINNDALDTIFVYDSTTGQLDAYDKAALKSNKKPSGVVYNV